MRIAVLSSRFPFPLERGDKLRLYHQLRELSKHHEIHLYAYEDRSLSAVDLEHLSPFCSGVTIIRTSLFQKLAGIFKAIRNAWPLQSGMCYSSRYHNELIKDLSVKGIDAVFCQLIRMAPYLDGVSQHKVLDYMDALGVGMEKRAGLSQWPLKWVYLWEAARVKKYEKKCAAHFDRLSVITKEDRLALQLHDHHVDVIPNGIDTDYFHALSQRNPKFEVGFIGNLGYLPNIGAAAYLAEDVATAYTSLYHQNLSILLAGARPDQGVMALESAHVKVTGWVEDIRTAYGDIKVLAAPIFFGTGQQNKILEAMACGIPVVCTPDVAKGVGASHGKELLVADDARAFAESIHLLLHDEQLMIRLTQQALAHVKSHFSWQQNTARLEHLLDPRYLT